MNGYWWKQPLPPQRLRQATSVANGLSRLLGTRFNVDLADNTASAIEQLAPQHDVVLLDLGLGDDDPGGLACLTRMRALGYDAAICIYTAHLERPLINETLARGATDFVLKVADPGDLLRCLDRLVALRHGIPPRGGPFAHSGYLISFGTSAEERDLLSRYHNTDYPPLKSLAFDLGISERALSKRFKRIRSRLGLDHQNQLVSLLTTLASFG